MENKIILTPIEKLDLVLITMKTKIEAWPFVSDGQLMTIIGKDKIDGLEIWQILQFLIKEEYVYKELQMKEGQNIAQYYITFEGSLLITKGGYAQKEADRLSLLAEKKKLETLEVRLKETQTIQNWWLVTLGSLAGLYSLVEVLKTWFQWAHNDFPY